MSVSRIVPKNWPSMLAKRLVSAKNFGSTKINFKKRSQSFEKKNIIEMSAFF